MSRSPAVTLGSLGAQPSNAKDIHQHTNVELDRSKQSAQYSIYRYLFHIMAIYS